MQKNGIIIMSSFAALWFVWGLSALGSVPVAVLLIPVAASGGLVAAALRLPGHRTQESRQRVQRIVGRASAAEFGAILTANIILAYTGHAAFGVCATAAIVGLHFLPLAHYLRVRSYYLTGAALMVLAAVGCAVGSDQTRLLTVALGAAVLLWITCLSVVLTKPEARPLAA